MLLQDSHQILARRRYSPHSHLPLDSSADQQSARAGYSHTSASLVMRIRDGEDDFARERSERPQASIIPAGDDTLAVLGKYHPGRNKIPNDDPQQLLEFRHGPQPDGLIRGSGKDQGKIAGIMRKSR